MKICVASDHAGFALKKSIVDYCERLGHQTVDLGPSSDARVDYPDFAAKVARAIQADEAERGILICGSGIGMSIAANRFRGVRAVLAMMPLQARLAREHNDANVLCLGERLVGPTLAEETVREFLEASFAQGRHAIRVEKIDGNAD